MLSAYLRLKYPWAADGALASSAPILQFPGLMPRNDINAFFNIITRDYKAYPGCAESIRLSWDVIDRLSSQHLSVFKNAFNLCDDLTTYDQVDTLKEWLSEAYIYMAMTDYQVRRRGSLFSLLIYLSLALNRPMTFSFLYKHEPRTKNSIPRTSCVLCLGSPSRPRASSSTSRMRSLRTLCCS